MSDNAVLILAADRIFGDGCTHAGIVLPVSASRRYARHLVAVVKAEAAAYGRTLRFAAVRRAADVIGWASTRDARIGMVLDRTERGRA